MKKMEPQRKQIIFFIPSIMALASTILCLFVLVFLAGVLQTIDCIGVVKNILLSP
jgi:hypothetical protein